MQPRVDSPRERRPAVVVTARTLPCPRTRGSSWGVFSLLVAVMGWTAGVHAEPAAPAPSAGPAPVLASGTPAEPSKQLVQQPLHLVEEGEPPSPYGETPLSWKRWALFDPFLDVRSGGVTVGYAELRELHDRKATRGASVAIRHEISTVRSHMESTLRVDTVTARGFSGGGVGLGLIGYDMLGGLNFKHARLGLGAGLEVLAADYMRRDFSFALASPRAVASLALRIARIRVGVSVSSSYYLRVYGRAPALLTSISLDISLESKPHPFRNRHPLAIE